MSDDETVICCGVCLRERGEYVRVVTERVGDVEVAAAGAVAACESRCPECGAVCGVSIDYGTLDLGLVREQVFAEGHNDFQLFG